MPRDSSNVHSLRRVFQQAFAVRDIAEPLVSFDDSGSSATLREFMTAHQFGVVGIRKDGRVQGYLELSDLGQDPAGDCAEQMKSFAPTDVILNSASLAELVLMLKGQRRLFVSVLGQVGGIVSRTDLQKPPARMWLFGMVTLIEMRFARLIEQHCGDEQWRQFLSPARIQKAETLLAERSRRNQGLALLDCLQLSDKMQIVARNEHLRSMTRFESRRQFEEAAKMVDKLRNNLAHSQDIITNDWDTIVALSESLDSVLEGPSG